MAVYVVLGPGPMFKGGIANYAASFARTLSQDPRNEVYLVSWSRQYPAIIPRDFIDRASRQDVLAGSRVRVVYLLDYNNPWSWYRTADYIIGLKPQAVFVQWTIALQGLPLGVVLRRLGQRAPGIERVLDLHNVGQKENSILDRRFARQAFLAADTFVPHSESMATDLTRMLPDLTFYRSTHGERAPRGSGHRTLIRLFHPVYDMFRPDPTFDREAEKQRLGLRRQVILFFGFIRKYKGLHDLLRAFRLVVDARQDVSLLIVGESFWQTLDQTRWSTRFKKAVFGLARSLLVRQTDNEQDYRPLELIAELGLEPHVVVVNRFVANEEVHRYFQVSDGLALYYTTSVPSGVESIAYNFGTPILATALGHFPETIIPGWNGYLAEPGNIPDMARQILRLLDEPIAPENVRANGLRFSWQNYAAALTYPYTTPTDPSD